MKIDLIKAWKDEEYRSTLTQEQLDQIKNPVGNISLSDEEMTNVNGGGLSFRFCEVENTGIDANSNVQSFNCCKIN